MKLSLVDSRIARWSRSFIARIGRARASPWFAPGLRASLAIAGLFVLAIVGRSALARSAEIPLEPRDPIGVSQFALPSTTSAPDITTAAVALDASVLVPLATPDPAASARSQSRGQATPDDPVILNQATLEDLERLPGIGPKKAQSILALRQRVGRFRQVDDLLRVRGIGRSTLKRLRPLLRLDPTSAVLDAGASRL